ncbi:uncharacterized protein LOC128549458 [Mercenaria mercenaria]|uniref:uncharacterized protein LOC128549458 n=1 Tax=Mercenaria mercenaria TaxID=6596 RepID=UPI00234EEA77|nr:uncharacterized protein LOC128549458 [Mercenaria mercenaria]
MLRSTESYISDKDHLNTICDEFGVGSTKVSEVCKEICTNLKSRSEEILKVWPAYRRSNPYRIVFVVITKSAVTSKKDVNIFEDFEVLLRGKTEKNVENKQVINHEVDSLTRIDLSQMEKLRTVIKDHSKTLREQHSNITMISASPFKSRGFMKGKHTLERKDCVVLYVHVKGLIPVQETCFPDVLDGFPVDVREAVIQLYAGGQPSDRHDQLKMGCAIGPQDRKCTGTLGGFVDIAEHGLCAITCAHVVIEEDNLKSKVLKETICFQPSIEYSNSKRCGKVVNHCFSTRSEEKSLDVAVIKLDKERSPVSGQFPDISKKDLIKAGFDENQTLQFTSGKVYDSSDIKENRDSRLIKYGASSRLRIGEFRFLGADIAKGPLMYSGNIELILDNLMQIYDIEGCGPFAEKGDSGSLVFSVSNSDSELTAVGMLLGGDDGFSVATPICDALYGIGCAAPCNLKCFDMETNRKEGMLYVRNVKF